MNKQSTSYTILYIIGLVLIVGTALTATSLALRSRQNENIKADKMRQILASALITTSKGENVVDLFNRVIVKQIVVNSAGQEIEGESAFDIDVAEQAKLPADERRLPVYVCRTDDGDKYILPAYGAGLWGPIWGYVSLDSDGSKIYGAFFAHQSETPGLGAEIEKPKFCKEFQGKELFKNGLFYPIAVVKAGQHPQNEADYVNGISGGTITSKGVSDMLDNCLSPYKNYLDKLRKQ